MPDIAAPKDPGRIPAIKGYRFDITNARENFGIAVQWALAEKEIEMQVWGGFVQKDASCFLDDIQFESAEENLRRLEINKKLAASSTPAQPADYFPVLDKVDKEIGNNNGAWDSDDLIALLHNRYEREIRAVNSLERKIGELVLEEAESRQTADKYILSLHPDRKKAADVQERLAKAAFKADLIQDQFIGADSKNFVLNLKLQMDLNLARDLERELQAEKRALADEVTLTPEQQAELECLMELAKTERQAIFGKQQALRKIKERSSGLIKFLYNVIDDAGAGTTSMSADARGIISAYLNPAQDL